MASKHFPKNPICNSRVLQINDKLNLLRYFEIGGGGDGIRQLLSNSFQESRMGHAPLPQIYVPVCVPFVRMASLTPKPVRVIVRSFCIVNADCLCSGLSFLDVALCAS